MTMIASPTAALALCRAVGDGALMLAFGAGLFATAAVPSALRRDAARRAGRLAACTAPIALLAALLRLPAQAAAFDDGWGAALDAGTLLAAASGTATGRAWAVQCGATLLFAAAVALRRDAPLSSDPAPSKTVAKDIVSSSAAMWTTAAGLALASLALSGHAAAMPGRSVAAPALALHLLAGGAWMGSLPEVLRLMALLGRDPGAGAAALALRRFSAAGHGVVALLVASGTLDAALIAGWPGDPVGSAYGQVLTLKVLLAVAMATLALVNRYRLVPRLAADRDAAARLSAQTRWVLALGLAAVAASGLLGLLDPP